MSLRVSRIMRVAAAAAACAAIEVAAQQASAPSPAPQGPIFRSGAYYVSVDAYPKKDGQIVDGLKAEDFEILEDGKPQKVETLKFYRVDPHTPDVAVHDPNTVSESLTRVADPANRVFVVYLDTYHVGVTGSHDIRKPLVDMLDRILAPNDLFAVATPDMRPRDMSFGRKLTTTAEELEKNWPWGQRDSIMRSPEEDQLNACFGYNSQGKVYIDDGGVQRWIGDIIRDRIREDKTLTNLEQMIEYLGNVREERKAVLTVTEGWVLYGPSPAMIASIAPNGGSPIGMRGGQLGIPTSVAQGSMAACDNELRRVADLDDRFRMQSIIKRANQLNVTFYPVNPDGLMVFDTPISDSPVALGDPNQSPLAWEFSRVAARTDAMKELANNTDGVAVVSNDLKGALKQITNELSAYYVLGYYSTNTKFDGKYRKIEVKLKPQLTRVTARRGYTAPTSTEMAARTTVMANAAVAVAKNADVDAALNVLGHLRSSSHVFGYGVTTGGPTPTLAFTAELSSAELDTGHWEQGAEVTATVTTAAGEAVTSGAARIAPGRRGVAFSVPLGTSAGPWRVKVGFTPKVGDALEDSFTVAPTPAALLSEPMISRAGTSQRSPLQPAADFQFSRNERAHLEFAEASPLDQRQARLLDRNGQALPIEVALSEKPSDVGGSVLVADVSFAPLAPGDYLIEVTASAGTAKIKKLVAIRVGT